jgi:CRISPR-associated protein Csb2
MALVAAQGDGEEDPDEAAALRWLEECGAPAISGSADAGYREPVTVFVPVNDTASPMPKNKPLAPMGSLPIGRIRQPRSFPTSIPESSDVYLNFDRELQPVYRAALARICAKVTYLGHSSSPVQMWIADDVPPAKWVPDINGPIKFRVAGKGRFDELRRLFNQGKRPTPALWHGYYLVRHESVPDVVASSFSDEIIILRQEDGRRFGLEAGYRLGQALRNTLMSRAGLTPAPPWLSGHMANGEPVRGEHLAIFPLGFVGRQYADAHVMGMGLAFPRCFEAEQRASVYRWLSDESNSYRVRLVLGQLGDCDLELDTRAETDRADTLKPSTYLGGDKGWQIWATVTPIVFEQFPRRRLLPGDVIIQSCLHAGLPRPARVTTGLASAHIGAPHSRAFPALPHRKDRPPRPMTHAVIDFGRPVRGPVLLGAGRYLGYGLCRPLVQGSKQ